MENNIINNGGVHNYSTQEHIVGKWIDGSDVYEKTISKTLSKGSQTVESATYISKLIATKGTFTRSDSITYNCPVYTASGDYCYYVLSSSKVLEATTTQSGTLYLTIQYIK